MTSNLGDILTQAVYTSNQLKSKVSEFQLYYSIVAKILKGFIIAKTGKNLFFGGGGTKTRSYELIFHPHIEWVEDELIWMSFSAQNQNF